jgi:hypothetical protein
LQDLQEEKALLDRNNSIKLLVENLENKTDLNNEE